ncbi:murein biosynthesis integral membrane protein MurJ [Paenibacillus thermotolerans]|uniref:murein biosynthesis integral membrane protein MurJ n=1 Tax=Paenibacillus thermotolerans TaxID=3027807 RepID=UPI0023682EF6|nr:MULTISPECIES: lipid II flippase MurJ [unclassified Paenibacillus]
MNLWKKPVAAVALINAGVALAAFVKDILLAAYTGTSLYADALIMALFLPDSFGNNMLSAAISVACVPIFSRLAATGNTDKLSSSMKRATIFFVAITVILTLLGYIFAVEIVGWLSGDAVRSAGAASRLAEATLPLFRLLLPIALLYIVFAIGTAVLQTYRRFTIPALAPLAGNVIFLGGVVYCIAAGLPISQGVAVIAAAITASAAVMAVWIGRTSLTAMKRMAPLAKEPPAAASHADDTDGRKDIMSLFVPYVTVLFCIQAVYLAERFLLSPYDTGAVAALNYAFRISQFPSWVFVAAVSTVILPSLAKQMALGEIGAMKLTMGEAFRSVILIAGPAMMFLFVLREPVTIALFQRGAFDERSVHLTSGILEGYSLTILSQALSLVLIRYFLAKRRLSGVVCVYLFSAVVTVVSDAALLRTIGVQGIGYGAMLGAAVNALLLLLMYCRSVRLGLREAIGNLRRYIAVLVPPVLLLPLLHMGWSSVPSSRAAIAIWFVLGSGCLYVLIYWLAVKRFWPSLAAAPSIMRKG